MENEKNEKKKIDWLLTLVPFITILILTIFLFIFPQQSNDIISKIRFFFGDTLGLYYLIIGMGIFLVSIFLAFSKCGDLVLGKPNEKPRYSFLCGEV